jgi:hypothetical protein
VNHWAIYRRDGAGERARAERLDGLVGAFPFSFPPAF